MEIPRHWRLIPENTGFRAQAHESDGIRVLRFPGGEVPVTNDYENLVERLKQKGFSDEVIESMLFDLFGAISSETAVSEGELVESFLELVGSEVGK